MKDISVDYTTGDILDEDKKDYQALSQLLTNVLMINTGELVFMPDKNFGGNIKSIMRNNEVSDEELLFLIKDAWKDYIDAKIIEDIISISTERKNENLSADILVKTGEGIFTVTI